MPLYKQISFFEQGKWSSFSGSLIYTGRADALACKQILKNHLFHKLSALLFLNSLLVLAGEISYPNFCTGRPNPTILMGALQQGHLNTGRGRCSIVFIKTCKIN